MQPIKKRIRLKCRHEGEIRTVILSPDCTFIQLKERLAQDYGFDVSLKYEDGDGDMITLSSQNDFDDLILSEPDTVNIIVNESTLPNLLARKGPLKQPSNLFPTSSLSTFGKEVMRPVATPRQSNLLVRMTSGAGTRSDRFPQIDGYGNGNLPVDAAIRWKKGEMLGQGAFGVVYLGLNVETGELMAVKQMAIDEVSSKTLSSLENEIFFLRSLRHSNIVRYIGTEVNPAALSIFLEYVPGGSLKALIDKFGQLEESVAKSYTRQLLLGLEYLHRNGIAHRDIKGANCLVGNDGVVKLADFGNSKRWRASMDPSVGTAQPSGDIKGTPSWMAPEVIKDQGGNISWRKADVWSLACTTLEMTTGKAPWSQFTNSVTVLYHIACQDTLPEYPNPASVELITFLNMCLQRDPALRPDITSLLLHPFVATGSAWNSAAAMGFSMRPSTTSLSGDWDKDRDRENKTSSGWRSINSRVAMSRASASRVDASRGSESPLNVANSIGEAGGASSLSGAGPGHSVGMPLGAGAGVGVPGNLRASMGVGLGGLAEEDVSEEITPRGSRRHSRPHSHDATSYSPRNSARSSELRGVTAAAVPMTSTSSSSSSSSAVVMTTTVSDPIANPEMAHEIDHNRAQGQGQGQGNRRLSSPRTQRGGSGSRPSLFLGDEAQVQAQVRVDAELIDLGPVVGVADSELTTLAPFPFPSPAAAPTSPARSTASGGALGGQGQGQGGTGSGSTATSTTGKRKGPRGGGNKKRGGAGAVDRKSVLISAAASTNYDSDGEAGGGSVASGTTATAGARTRAAKAQTPSGTSSSSFSLSKSRSAKKLPSTAGVGAGSWSAGDGGSRGEGKVGIGDVTPALDKGPNKKSQTRLSNLFSNVDDPASGLGLGLGVGGPLGQEKKSMGAQSKEGGAKGKKAPESAAAKGSPPSSEGAYHFSMPPSSLYVSPPCTYASSVDGMSDLEASMYGSADDMSLAGGGDGSCDEVDTEDEVDFVGEEVDVPLQATRKIHDDEANRVSLGIADASGKGVKGSSASASSSDRRRWSITAAEGKAKGAHGDVGGDKDEGVAGGMGPSDKGGASTRRDQQRSRAHSATLSRDNDELLYPSGSSSGARSKGDADDEPLDEFDSSTDSAQASVFTADMESTDFQTSSVSQTVPSDSGSGSAARAKSVAAVLTSTSNVLGRSPNRLAPMKPRGAGAGAGPEGHRGDLDLQSFDSSADSLPLQIRGCTLGSPTSGGAPQAPVSFSHDGHTDSATKGQRRSPGGDSSHGSNSGGKGDKRLAVVTTAPSMGRQQRLLEEDDGAEGRDDDTDNEEEKGGVAEACFESLAPVVLEEHAGPVTRLRAVKHSNLFISGSVDGTVRVWSGTDSSSRLVLDAGTFSTGGRGEGSANASGGGGGPSTQLAPVELRMDRRSLGAGGGAASGGGGVKGAQSGASEGPELAGGGGGGGAVGSKGVKVLNVWADDHCSHIWSACSDGGVRVWSGLDGKPLRSFKGHDDAITVMEGGGGVVGATGNAMGPALMSTGSVDKTLRIWDVRAKRPQAFLFRGHSDTILALRWGEGGRSVVSASKDKSVRIWDTRAGRLRVTMEKHFGAVNALRVMPDGASGGVGGPGSNIAYISGGRDSMLNLWAESGDSLATLTAHRGSVNFLSDVSVDAQFRSSVQANTPLVLSAGNDNVVKIWDLKRMRSVGEIGVGSGAGGAGALTKAVWAGPGIVTTVGGSVRFYEFSMSSSAAAAGAGGGGGGAGEGERAMPVAPTPKGGGEWLVSELGAHSQTCTDLLSTDAILVSASKSGHLLRWNRQCP